MAENFMMFVAVLFFLFIGFMGYNNIQEWRDCKARGGSYVQTLEFGNGYSCVDLKEK